MATPAEVFPPQLGTDVDESVQPISARPSVDTDGVWAQQRWISRTLYWGIHAACVLVFVVGVSTGDLVLLAATFWARLFGITGGYHRYFSHKTYKTSRVFQFVLAWLGASSVQKGPLWWAANHRLHHRKSDQPGDPHSPNDGFWYSHTGWIFDGRWDVTRVDLIEDFNQYPELRWLNRWHIVPPVVLALLCLWIGGWSGGVWGFLVSTTLLWHSTYTINSLAHRMGRRRYPTHDDSRNSLLLALLTWGEGWHNNHHFFQGSTRQGFFWWEIDITYYVLRSLQAVGLVWDMREPPQALINDPKRRIQAAS